MLITKNNGHFCCYKYIMCLRYKDLMRSIKKIETMDRFVEKIDMTTEDFLSLKKQKLFLDNFDPCRQLSLIKTGVLGLLHGICVIVEKKYNSTILTSNTGVIYEIEEEIDLGNVKMKWIANVCL
jgi:hypothetical protein